MLTFWRDRQVYILPTSAGWGFVLLLVLLLLMAINFENNLVFALTFLLTGVMLVTMIHAWANLRALQVRVLGAPPCFAGEMAAFRIQLSAPSGREVERICLHWPPHAKGWADLLESRQCEVELSYPAVKRGWLQPAVLQVSSVFPMGLFRCWCRIPVQERALVYPQPREVRIDQDVGGSEGEGAELDLRGSDDFSGLTRFEPGMSPQHIAWKAYARGQGLQAKQYATLADEQQWLDWEAWPGFGDEARLSVLCFHAVRLGREGSVYGLRLPNQTIGPGRGDAHQQQVLKALALYGSEA